MTFIPFWQAQPKFETITEFEFYHHHPAPQNDLSVVPHGIMAWMHDNASSQWTATIWAPPINFTGSTRCKLWSSAADAMLLKLTFGDLIDMRSLDLTPFIRRD